MYIVGNAMPPAAHTAMTVTASRTCIHVSPRNQVHFVKYFNDVVYKYSVNMLFICRYEGIHAEQLS